MTGKEVIHHDGEANHGAPGAFGQGVAVDLTRVAPGDRHRAFTEACDYRGDVTLELTDGSSLECFVFDHRAPGTPGATPTEGCLRVMLTQDGQKRQIPYEQIRRLIFSGKDTAAGKTWEAWVKRYIEKRMAGERASIESEVLD